MPDCRDLTDVYLEQSHVVHWMVDADGVFQRVYGDPLAILGRTADELRGQPVACALPSESAGLWMRRFARALKGETVLLRERRGENTWYVGVFPLCAEDGRSFAGGMAADITPWSTAEHELRQTVLHVLKAQEFERNRASRFLHDVVGQNLTAFGLQLDLIRMDLAGVQPQSCGRVEEVQRVLESMMEEVREYSYELNPSAVERTGLRAALDRLQARIRKRFSGGVRVNVDPSLKLHPRMATAMYQIVQEAVQNAVQHAGCSSIEIAVKSTRNGPLLEVHDNGKGFDPGDVLAVRRGLGILCMEYYAAEAGLDFSLTSEPGKGTAVRAARAGDR